MMGSKHNRYKRYVKYMTRYLFKERLFGLDFSMRDASLLKKTHGVMHGYCASPTEHLKKIFDGLDHPERARFLDIGCGKGLALRIAHERFAKVTGVEYDQRLADICERNMRRLGMDDVRVFCGDAREFDNYDSYDVFYLANPFDGEILKPVLDKLPRGATIIYYHPICHQLVLDTGRFRLVRSLYDKERSYDTYIYESID